MSLRNRLAAIFSPTRRLADAGREVVSEGGVLGGLQWVVPRADCHYRRIELPAVPSRKRDAAARIAARRFEPQPEALFHVAWTGDTAHVWSWPAPVADIDEASWIPETLLRPPASRDGLHLLGLVRGVEGQSWRDGTLRASQWWPEPPSLREWQHFARACGFGLEAASTVPLVESPRWDEPWGSGARGVQASPAVLERWGWRAVVTVVLLLLGWQLAAQLSWAVARERLDDRLAALRSEATPLLAARERAEVALGSLRLLLDLQLGFSDYQLMADVIAPLPADARLVEWQRDGRNLAVIVQSADTDPRLFVSAYTGHPQLSGVVATPMPEGAMGLEFALPDGSAIGGPGEPAP